jgi:uncharacterized protein YlxW (UPF0749 family)
LLDDLLTNTLDPAYAEVAARRKAGRGATTTRSAPVNRPLLVLALLGVGVVLAAAAGQQRIDAPDAARARAQLAREVGSRTASVAALTAQIERLRDETGAARDSQLALSRDGALLASTLRDLEQATGAVALEGPGLVVRVSDAPSPGVGGRPAGSTRDEGRVQDRDLQDVVNALWAAGAKGIAVNGIRLTAQTSIRSAGEAILVDFRPLASPYSISVVGDPDTLQSSFANSEVARRFDTWAQLYQLGLSVRQSGSVHLPAAAPTAPRHAIVLRPPGASASPRATSSTPGSPTPTESSP